MIPALVFHWKEKHVGEESFPSLACPSADLSHTEITLCCGNCNPSGKQAQTLRVEKDLEFILSLVDLLGHQ